MQKVERASEPLASRNAPRGAAPPPTERQLYRLEAARSDENEIFFFGELESIEVGTPGSSVGGQEDLRRKVAEAFKGVGYGYTMTPQGQPLETDAPMMSRAGFRDLRLLLPEEEIGVGGVWRYEQVVPEADLQMATQIQITKMDAHGFVAKLLVEGISEGFALRREGTCKIILNRLAPVEMDLTDTIQLTEPAAPAGDKPSMPKVTNIRMKIRVRETLYAGVAEIGKELGQADQFVNEARGLWDKNDRTGSLLAAERALALRRKWLGEDHAKARELKEMIRGARAMIK